MKNEIIDEIRKHRAMILESFDGDIEKMMLAMMAKQSSGEHRVVTFKKKESQQGVAINAYPLHKQA